MRDSFFSVDDIASRMLPRQDWSGTRILNSFSMGRSSALLSEMLPRLYPGAEIVTVTANTGQERPGKPRLRKAGRRAPRAERHARRGGGSRGATRNCAEACYPFAS